MLIPNNFEAQNILQRELITDEKLLWCGRPRKGIIFRTSDIFAIPFSLLWFGFAIFWESAAVKNGPFFFMLWGIPFILVGLYMSIGRFFYDRQNRANTVYGVTNNRVIIKSGVFKITVESFNIQTMFNMSIDEKQDGSGTIKLDTDNATFASFNIPGLQGRNNKPAPAIELIQNVREVYNLILQQQHKRAPTI